jgi:hypothetical protein
VAALWFDNLVILDPVGASSNTIGADHVARDAVTLLKDAGILEIITPSTVLAQYEKPIAEAIRRDMADRDFLDLCDAESQSSGKQRWTLSLIAGLLHAGATPISDDPFHSRALEHKLARSLGDPAVQAVRTQRARQHKIDLLASAGLMDSQLSLPVLNPALPLEEVLEYRQRHTADLQQARDTLGWMARRIQAEPWTKEFAEDLEHRVIPDLAGELEKARQARDSWLESRRGRLALSATGIGVGAAAAVLSVFAAPVTTVALATAGLGLVSGTVIPGTEWFLDWQEGKNSVQENGLHYLLRV